MEKSTSFRWVLNISSDVALDTLFGGNAFRISE